MKPVLTFKSVEIVSSTMFDIRAEIASFNNIIYDRYWLTFTPEIALNWIASNILKTVAEDVRWGREPIPETLEGLLGFSKQVETQLEEINSLLGLPESDIIKAFEKLGVKIL